MKTPKISIVIPTRNRTQFLIDTVNVALSHCSNVEVVVSDNSDTDIARVGLLTAIDTGRVVYDHSGELKSVVQNFEHAVSLSSGDWIMVIGDDDAIGPGLDQIVNWATLNGVDAVVPYKSSFTVSYYWPGVVSKYYGAAYSSRLFLWPFDGGVEHIDAKAELRNVSSRFGGNLGSLPRIYHGLISRNLLNRIQSRHGHIFGGVSPDIYSATLIAAHSRKSVIIDFPFVIPGTSKSSTAGQGAERSDRAQLRQTDHIARFGPALKWDHRIPEFYSPQTVWAYSLLKALEEVPELGVSPSFARLYAKCLLFCRPYASETLHTIKLKSRGVAAFMLLALIVFELAIEVGEMGAKIARRILAPRAMGGADRIENLDTISAAYNALLENLASTGRALKLPKNCD